MTQTGVAARARSKWFALMFLAVFAYMDWITHRSIGFIVVGGGIAVALMLFPDEIRKRTGVQGSVLASVPERFRPLVYALPGLLYLVFRGQGTSGAGLSVTVISLLAGTAVGVYSKEIDQRLAGYYKVRNRILPRVARLILTPVVAILLSFLVIHGTLRDIPAMWGGTTSAPRSPAGLLGRFVLASLLSMAASIALVREPQR